MPRQVTPQRSLSPHSCHLVDCGPAGPGGLEVSLTLTGHSLEDTCPGSATGARDCGGWGFSLCLTVTSGQLPR